MNTTVGTARLVRLVVRRDRVRIGLWIFGLVALLVVSANSISNLYDTPAEIRGYVETVGDNPALVVFAGPGYGFDAPTTGAILVNETTLWLALAAAVMNAFAVLRHTRAEEDAERADLLSATVIGRHARLAAALVVAALTDLVVVVGCTLGCIALGYTAAGSVALAVGVGLTGLAFGAAAAVFAQIPGSSRGATGLSVGLIALAFVVRGIGDVAAPALAWTTPFGWGIGVRAFADERWWTFALLVAFTSVAVAAAVTVANRRDLGSGLLSARRGPDGAAAWIRSPLGLALRLQRGQIAAWTFGMGIAGLVYGTVADDIEQMLEDNPDLADFLARTGGATLTDAYLSTSLRLLALVAGGFAIASGLRPRGDESVGLAEQVLATPVRRWRWVGAQLAVTVLGVLAVVVAGGLGMGVGYATSIGDAGQIGRLVVGSLATAPIPLILAAVGVAVFGWLPRATAAAWAALAAVAVIDLFGAVLQLPNWLIDLSPSTHVHAPPARDWEALPLAVAALVAVGLVVAGLVGFTRRDLAQG